MADDNQNEPRIATSVEMKVNLGNYESASCFISLSNIAAGTTPAEIEALLDTGRIVYDALKRRLQLQINDLRAKKVA